MQEMDSKQHLIDFVSRLNIPLAKVEYRKVESPAHAPSDAMQSSMFGEALPASYVVKMQTKNNSVKSQAKRKVRTSDEATIAFINSVKV